MRSTLLLFLLFSILGGSSVLQAQIINTEKFRLDKDTSHCYIGTVGAGMNARKQKVNYFRLHFNTHAGYLAEKHSYLLINQLGLVKVSDQKVISDGFAHLRANWFRRKKISLESFAQIQYDLGRDLEARRLIGSAARIVLVNESEIGISFNIGPMYELEKWRLQNDILKRDYFKLTSNINTRVRINKQSSIVAVLYYQTPFKYSSLPRVAMDLNARYMLSQQLSIALELTWIYDYRPIVPVGKWIYNLQTSVNYAF